MARVHAPICEHRRRERLAALLPAVAASAGTKKQLPPQVPRSDFTGSTAPAAKVSIPLMKSAPLPLIARNLICRSRQRVAFEIALTRCQRRGASSLRILHARQAVSAATLEQEGNAGTALGASLCCHCLRSTRVRLMQVTRGRRREGFTGPHRKAKCAEVFPPLSSRC
ncbi:hypothetical protein MTO96_013783 [Rhipicephalus appendiculatus]